jgi:hypothetical protein
VGAVVSTPSHEAPRPSHAEILQLLDEGGEANEDHVMVTLREIAQSYRLDEVFGVMALVDTPDVFG